jgi:diaminopimelate decarboxylase
VVIRDAGAYGFVMASEYNGRGLPVEIFLSGGKIAAVHESRSREAWVASRIF